MCGLKSSENKHEKATSKAARFLVGPSRAERGIAGHSNKQARRLSYQERSQRHSLAARNSRVTASTISTLTDRSKRGL